MSNPAARTMFRPSTFPVLAGLMLFAPDVRAAQALPAPVPACTAPEFHQFDFWIGDWDVFDGKGQKIGSNDITRPLGECVLQEHWAGARGMKGQSFNMYDATRGVWHQTWVDDSGTILLLEGGLVDGKMVLRGETAAHAGRPAMRHRITWEPRTDGAVRQFWETSTDGGTTWAASFDGLYRKRTP